MIKREGGGSQEKGEKRRYRAHAARVFQRSTTHRTRSRCTVTAAASPPSREDAFAAYTHALLWAITDDERHALKAIECLDGWPLAWTTPIDNANGLQVAWAGAVWPRAAEIIKHTYRAWPGADAFGAMLQRLVVPMVDQGAPINGNIGLVMTEAVLHAAVLTDNRSQFDAAIAMWRAQARAYVYVSADGPLPARPPAQRYLNNTSPVCDPQCDDASLITYWHAQGVFGHDGICQESCRDFGHVELGYMTLVNSAETAWHQGVDVYAEEQQRLIAGAELHASLLAAEPPGRRQPVPTWLCDGHVKGADNSSTWAMLHHHYTMRMGVATLPNVTAMLTSIRQNSACWDQARAAGRP